MKPSTINFIGTFGMFALQLGVAAGGIYCAYWGHWFAGLLCFWVAESLKWKNDGKWVSEEINNDSK